MNKNIAGMYGSYELVPVTEETISQYFEECLENIDANEMHEAWQLYHLCVKDVLEKVFLNVKEGRSEAYFLLYHYTEEKKEVLGIGGLGTLADIGADFGMDVGEIWFMGQSLIRHKRFLVRYGREIIAKILPRYSMLLNAAAAWNDEAFKLVKFLGFTVGKKCIRTGMDKALFNYFYMIRK